jgi:hypothetical protein
MPESFRNPECDNFLTQTDLRISNWRRQIEDIEEAVSKGKLKPAFDKI